jgi:hypothetical protein
MATPSTPRTSGSSTTGPATNPATVLAAQANQIQQLEAQISELMAAVTARPGPGGPTAKLSVPEKYEGGREGLKTFLTNMDLYCRFNAASFANDQDKILAAGMHMKGKAAAWLQPLTEDYLQNVDDISECKNDTKRVFEDWKSFKEAITTMFGEIDEEQQAERAISMIKQKGSANRYTAEFKQLQSKIDWDDAPLKTAYYNGLRENIKDEIAHNDRPDDLQDMIELATRIDNRMYERALEKKSQPRPIVANTGRGRRLHVTRRDRDGDVIMDIDKVQEYKKGARKDTRKSYKPTKDGVSEKERQKRFEEKACLRCGQQGHFRRDCPKNQDRVNAIKIAVVKFQEESDTPPTTTERETPAPGLPGFQQEDADVSPCQLEEPEKKPDHTQEAGKCWVCSTSYHPNTGCPREEDREAKCAEQDKSHLEESWYQCTRDDCGAHSLRLEEVRWQPGDSSHIFVSKEDCMVARCHTHWFEEWQKNHDMTEWMRCYEDSCGKHWPMKHLTGQWPLGPGSWTTMKCDNEACDQSHPTRSHAKRPWRACKKEDCLYHTALREKSATHAEHYEHAYLMPDECIDATCRRHGGGGRRGTYKPNHDRASKAKEGWREIYAELEDQMMRESIARLRELELVAEKAPGPEWTLEEADEDDDWASGAWVEVANENPSNEDQQLEDECRKLTNDVVRKAILEEESKN